jgi:hypothetical protein
VALDLWKLELLVLWVHQFDLVDRGCAEDLDDLYQLVGGALTREERFAQQHLGYHATNRPHVDRW